MSTITLPSGNTVETVDPTTLPASTQRDFIKGLDAVKIACIEADPNVTNRTIWLAQRGVVYAAVVTAWSLDAPLPDETGAYEDVLTIPDANALWAELHGAVDALSPVFDFSTATEAPDSPKVEGSTESLPSPATSSGTPSDTPIPSETTTPTAEPAAAPESSDTVTGTAV